MIEVTKELAKIFNDFKFLGERAVKTGPVNVNNFREQFEKLNDKKGFLEALKLLDASDSDGELIDMDAIMGSLQTVSGLVDTLCL